MPTSVYGSKIVPAEIRILGHVTPDVFPDIKSFTKTGYYRDESVHFDGDLKAFYNGPSAGLNYTKIEINAPSKFFTDDLWVKNSAPLKTFYQSFIARQILFDVFFLIIFCSVITGALVGWILFREWRNWEGVKKFGLIGLANCFSILGLIAAILPSKTLKNSENPSSLLDKIKERGYFWRKKVALGLIIVDLPFLVISIFAIPASVMRLFEILSDPEYFDGLWSEDYLIFALALVPIIVLFAAWYLSRIKAEDRELFHELKLKKYSSWTFQPKDRRKIWFVLLYSILFLIISWVIVKMLGLSVGGQAISSGNSGIQF